MSQRDLTCNRSFVVVGELTWVQVNTEAGVDLHHIQPFEALHHNGLSATGQYLLRHITLPILGTGIVDIFLKQVGTSIRSSESLKMSAENSSNLVHADFENTVTYQHEGWLFLRVHPCEGSSDIDLWV